MAQGDYQEVGIEGKDFKDHIWGIRAVEEALLQGRSVSKIMAIREPGPGVSTVLKVARDRDIPVQYLPMEALNRHVRGNHQGIIAMVAAIDFQELEPVVQNIIDSGQKPFVLILDRITDVRNFGAIIRSADAAGVHAVVVPQGGAAFMGGDAVKSSAGALFNVPICRVTHLMDAVQFLQACEIPVIACSEHAEQEFTEVQISLPAALLMGNEGEGIDKRLFKAADQRVKIPMRGRVGSLNVSVAAGIMLYSVRV